MDLQALFRKHSAGVIGLATESDSGRVSMGTAFHIGDGFFVTARHVVEGREITDVVSSRWAQISTIHSVHYPRDPQVDLAILSTDFDLSYYMSEQVRYEGGEWPKGDAFVLGDHLDDWIGDEMIMMPILMMGYPPVPTSREPVLLAVSGEVNGVIDLYTTPHVHFVVSSPARGGFSGGPVLHAGGVLLGVVTESLQRQDEVGEPGFAVALSVEPIFSLIAELGIAPRANRLGLYLMAWTDEDLKVFDSLLTEEERDQFDNWKDNLLTATRPTEVGVPSPPLLQDTAVWSAPADRLGR